MQEDRTESRRTSEAASSESVGADVSVAHMPISRELVVSIETVLGFARRELAQSIADYLHNEGRLPITPKTWTTTQQGIIEIMRGSHPPARGAEALAVDARIQMEAQRIVDVLRGAATANDTRAIRITSGTSQYPVPTLAVTEINSSRAPRLETR